MNSLSDDYYDELHIKYLVGEYERTIMQKKKFQLLLLQTVSEEAEAKEKRSCLNRHIQRLEHKEELLDQKIETLCEKVGIE